jgi:hypothetical protein
MSFIRRTSPSLVLLAFLVLAAGCQDSSDPTTDTDTSEQQQSVATEGEKCRSRLAGAIRRLKPENFAHLSRREQASSGLNAWLASCAGDELMAMTVSDQTLSYLPASVKPMLTAPRFSVPDTQFIRDCLAMRSLADALSERIGDAEGYADPETGRIVGVFDWVVRNISLLADSEERVALELFDVLLTGRGTAEDRAWVFAEILRQREIDAVIIRPSEEATAETNAVDKSGQAVIDRAKWLVAVVAGERVLLFDPVAGVPVYDSPNPSLAVDSPAGMSVLEGSDRWQNLMIHPVAQTIAFSNRMYVLQEQLAAEDAAVFYEELAGGTTEILPLLDRVKSAGGPLFADAKIEVWTYPDEQVAAAASRVSEDQLAYAGVMKPFDAPFERQDEAEIPNINELSRLPEELTPEEREEALATRLYEEFARAVQSSDDLFGVASGKLKKARIRQVLGGDLAVTIQQLQQIRLASMQTSVSFRVPGDLFPDGREVYVVNMPPAIFEVNQSATSSCLYWTALAQYEQHQHGAAIATLQNYRRQYPGGQWQYASLLYEGLAEEALGNREAAVARLKEADQPDNPERQRVQTLIGFLQPGSPDAEPE